MAPRQSRKKKAHISPSIITNSDPPAYSESSVSPSESELSQAENDIPVVTPKKRKKSTVPATTAPAMAVDKSITYILSIFTTDDMKKAVAKRCPKTLSLQLTVDEPWDTVKAQFLAKISQALNPAVIDYENYTVMFSIPRILSKPGAPLQSDEDYKLLLRYYAKCTPGKEHAINVIVTENGNTTAAEKENDDPKKKKGNKVRF